MQEFKYSKRLDYHLQNQAFGNLPTKFQSTGLHTFVLHVL